MMISVPRTYADDDKSDTNSNMANVSEEASNREIYGAKASGDSKGSNIEQILGDKYTSAAHKDTNKGLNSVAASWSFLGLNTDSGLLKPGDADTAEVSLQSLIIYNTKSDSTSNAVLKAASLPAVLQKNGLDTTKMGGLNTVARFVMGAILWVGLAIALITNVILSLVIWAIGALNPFVIIQALMNNSGYEMLKIPTAWKDIPILGNLTQSDNIFGQIANLILSWTIPTLIIILFAIVITMLFWVPYSRRSRTQGSLMVGLKKVLKQLTIILILPSIAGSIFMSAYSLSTNSIQAPARSVQNLVQSTFVQFGAWSDHSRLYIPPTDKYNGGNALKADVPEDNNTDSATKWRYKAPTQVPIKPSYILAINALGARTPDAVKAFSNSTSFDWTGASDKDTSDDAKLTAGNGNGDSLPSMKTTMIRDAMDKLSGLQSTFSMVTSWTSADRYSASSYAGTVENQYNATNKDKQQSYNQAGEIINDIKSYKDKDEVSPYLQTSGNAIRYDMNKGFYSNAMSSVPGANTVESLIGKDSNYAGLSAVGMWNYLNSTIDKGTLTQHDPRKTQNKDSVSHANVVLPGGAVLGFLSIMVILAFIAATTFPTLAVAILMGRIAMEAFTGWDKIIFALGGSIKAWARLIQIGIKLIVGMFMLGFISLITPSIAAGIITLLDDWFAGSKSWGAFAVGKGIEVIALLLVAWLLFTAFRNSMSFFDAMTPSALKGETKDTAGAAKSIFDRSYANAVDQMTAGSNSKLGRMINEANDYDARHNENFARNARGDLLRDSDGKWGLAADMGYREDEHGNRVPYAKSQQERADERMEKRKQMMKDHVMGTNAQRDADRLKYEEDLANARDELQKLGVDIPKTDELNAREVLKNTVRDESLLTPEMEAAAGDLQDAAENLEDLGEAEEAAKSKDLLDKFVKSPVSTAKDALIGEKDHMSNALKATTLGTLIGEAKEASKIRSAAKTPEAVAARVKQLQALKENKDVDDSLYGGMSKDEQHELEEKISDPVVAVKDVDANAQYKDFQKSTKQEYSNLERKKSELEAKQAEIQSKRDSLKDSKGVRTPLTQAYKGNGEISETRVKFDETADAYMRAQGIETDDVAQNDRTRAGIRETLLAQDNGTGLDQSYSQFMQQSRGNLEKLGQKAHAEAMVAKWADNPDKQHGSAEDLRAAARHNYETSRKTQLQATRAVFDSIEDPVERMDLMGKAQKSYQSYIGSQIAAAQKQFADDMNDGVRDSMSDKLAVENVMSKHLGNQPRNYGIFSGDVAKNMQSGMSREAALQEAYKKAVSRQDEYQLLPRNFGGDDVSYNLFGKDSAPLRAQDMVLQQQYEDLGRQRDAVVNKMSEVGVIADPNLAKTEEASMNRVKTTLQHAGISQFEKRPVTDEAVTRRYMKPNASAKLTVGDVYKPLKEYADLANAHKMQVPVTGFKFTSQELAGRQRMERRMAEMRKNLVNMGVSEYALKDDHRTSKMIEDFDHVRKHYADTYASFESKIDRL